MQQNQSSLPSDTRRVAALRHHIQELLPANSTASRHRKGTIVLRKTLNNSVKVPMLGYDVFQTPSEEVERYVTEALDVGYRLIDTTQTYDNEEGVGAAVRANGTPREEVFIISKIWMASINYERMVAPIDGSLRKLDTDYIDLIPLYRAMGDYPGAYRAMEDTYGANKLRAIGVSNFYPGHLVDVVLFAETPSAINQIETHPFRQQDVAHEVMTEFGVVHKAWTPFAEGQNNTFTNPVLTRIGEKYGKKPGQMILRVLMWKDVIVTPKTTHRNRMEENFDTFDFELHAEGLTVSATLDDGSLPHIFDHYDPKAVTWMLRDYVKNNQLGGGTLHWEHRLVHAICADT